MTLFAQVRAWWQRRGTGPETKTDEPVLSDDETRAIERRLLMQSYDMGIDQRLRDGNLSLQREKRQLDHLRAQLDVYMRGVDDDPEPSRGR